jgi:hypothetical protein
MRRLRHLLTLCFAVGLSGVLRAQGVLVAPHGVFIDHHTRTASVELYNPGVQAVEVSLSMLFGYPVSDSLGNVTLYVAEKADSSQPSAAGWIEAYPRRLTLRPRERQRVRLFARPPADLPDGEYWTRLVVTTTGVQLPSAGAETASMRVGLTLEMRTIVAAFYRKGPVRTAVALSDVRAQLVGDSIVVRARLARQGNAAYLGMANGRVLDGNGRHVASFASQVAVYHFLEPRFVVPARSLAPGRYTVHLEFTTNRDDLARDAVLRAATVRDSAVVTVGQWR